MYHARPSDLTVVELASFIWTLANTPGSELCIAINGEEFRGWDVQTYLLAGILDLCNRIVWSNFQAVSPKKVKEPKPIALPGDNKKRMQANPAVQRLLALRNGG